MRYIINTFDKEQDAILNAEDETLRKKAADLGSALFQVEGQTHRYDATYITQTGVSFAHASQGQSCIAVTDGELLHPYRIAVAVETIPEEFESEMELLRPGQAISRLASAPKLFFLRMAGGVILCVAIRTYDNCFF